MIRSLRKLRQVGSAESLEDLRLPPRYRLEGLKGDWAGQHIWINGQWRTCSVRSAAYDLDLAEDRVWDQIVQVA